MESHYTPGHLLKVIRKHLPKNMLNILEPSVGNGALLKALKIPNSHLIADHVTTFDVSKKPLGLIRKEFKGLFGRLTIRNQCFLEWYYKGKKRKLFDLIIMNPPFSGKSENWVKFKERNLPMEIHFLRAAIDLCEDKGRIVAILPNSVINGERTCSKEIRALLFGVMNVQYVYELNTYEFPEVEGKFFLLICTKEGKQGTVKLRKQGASEIALSRTYLGKHGSRLDFSYYDSRSKFENTFCSPQFEFSRLGDVVDIKRGELSPPYDKMRVLHTTSYNGHWNSGSYTIFNKLENRVSVEKYDILVKRVGREILNSFGMVQLRRKQIATDCLLILKCKQKNENSYRILFSLRVLYSCELGRDILLRGTGANYLASATLREAKVITNLHKVFIREYRDYIGACILNNSALMYEIEEKVRNKIQNNQKGAFSGSLVRKLR